MKDVGSSWKLCLIGIVGYFKPTDTIKCLVDICVTNQTLLWIPVLCIMFWGIIYSSAATEMLSYRNMFPLNPVFIISDYPVFRLEWNKSEMCCWFSLESALCRCRCSRSWKCMFSIQLVCIFFTSSATFCMFDSKKRKTSPINSESNDLITAAQVLRRNCLVWAAQWHQVGVWWLRPDGGFLTICQCEGEDRRPRLHFVCFNGVWDSLMRESESLTQI